MERSDVEVQRLRLRFTDFVFLPLEVRDQLKIVLRQTFEDLFVLLVDASLEVGIAELELMLPAKAKRTRLLLGSFMIVEYLQTGIGFRVNLLADVPSRIKTLNRGLNEEHVPLDLRTVLVARQHRSEHLGASELVESAIGDGQHHKALLVLAYLEV